MERRMSVKCRPFQVTSGHWQTPENISWPGTIALDQVRCPHPRRGSIPPAPQRPQCPSTRVFAGGRNPTLPKRTRSPGRSPGPTSDRWTGKCGVPLPSTRFQVAEAHFTHRRRGPRADKGRMPTRGSHRRASCDKGRVPICDGALPERDWLGKPSPAKRDAPTYGRVTGSTVGPRIDSDRFQ